MKYATKKVFLLSFLFFSFLVFGRDRIYYVNDNAGLLNPNEWGKISGKLSTIEKQTSVQFVVFTVESTKNKTIEEYSIELAQTLGIGQKGINNGILILMASKSREIRLEVGYGIEWILSDKKSKNILEAIIPYLEKNDYFRGFIKGIDLIDQQISKYDWKINTITLKELKNLKDELKNKIVCFPYSSKRAESIYTPPPLTGKQFDKTFKIRLIIDNNNSAELFYTKYMNDLVREILAGRKVKIYSRVRRISPIQLELLGVTED